MQDDTSPAEVQPKGKHPPQLIGIGTFETGTLSLTCFVDSEPWFSEDDPFRAMLMLLSLFFVAKVKWPAPTRLPLQFLVCAVAGVKMVRKPINANQKLVDLLKRLKIYN